jgi:hypothetical protein
MDLKHIVCEGGNKTECEQGGIAEIYKDGIGP